MIYEHLVGHSPSFLKSNRVLLSVVLAVKATSCSLCVTSTTQWMMH